MTIEVSIGTDPAVLGEAWRALVAEAAPNVFMAPEGLAAVAATGFARTHILAAFDVGETDRRLVGMWALEEKRLMRFGPRYLSSPPHYYSFVGSPMIEPSLADPVSVAFFAAIAADRRLPKALRLKYLDGDAPTHGALMRALSARQARGPSPLERTRPFATKESGIKRSGSTRKKLRQDWNRLSAGGVADYVNDRSPAAVAAAFEAFLDLEMSSWKGEAGSALLCNDRDTAFTRRFITGLAAEGSASVALLRVDGTAIAAQVLLYCGRRAYTWKIAFSAGYSKYSPGALLVDKVAEELFAGDIDSIESCSPEGGFMAQMWDGRRKTVDCLVSIAGRPSFALAAIQTHDRLRSAVKEFRNRVRAIEWRKPEGVALPQLAGRLRLLVVTLARRFGLGVSRTDHRPQLDGNSPQERGLLDKALGSRPGDIG
jgi:CelD/BcsL family acetyltransferase involved in cellulose biosynthesis